ncbi:MAG TPA: hypothetical protein VJ944_04880 [Thermoplasmataceae archaeon]|nr:hypothetical protein [Thermoplasmataceae archaeon]
MTVVFQNGTKEMANSTMFLNQYSLTAKFHFKGGLGEPGFSSSGGIANISISSGDPLAVASISNISENFFLHHLSGTLRLYGSNVNYYMIYIDSYATVSVKAVGGSF